MLSLLLVSLLSHGARRPCTNNLLGARLRRIKVADDTETLRQRAASNDLARALPRVLKRHLPAFAQQGFARIVEVEPDDPIDLRTGWGPKLEGRDYEPWLTLPGRLIKDTDVGAKPTPFAEEILKYCKTQELHAVLYHWRPKETFDGVVYGQWYDVTTRVTKPTLPPDTYGQPRPHFSGTVRRGEPDERTFSLGKGQPDSFVRITWK